MDSVFFDIAAEMMLNGCTASKFLLFFIFCTIFINNYFFYIKHTLVYNLSSHLL